jgi:hypothetical protein
LLNQKIKRSQQLQPKDDVLSGVRPVADVVRFPSFVLYGRSSTGKTTLAATWPKPMLYLDVKDEGTHSILDVKGIDVKDITTFEEFELTYWWLKEHPKRYSTVVIDTVSQLQQVVIQEYAAAMRKKNKSNRSAGDWGTLTKRDWGDIAGLMKEWLINYRDLSATGTYVVFIAQDRVFNVSDEDDAGGMLDPEVGPGLSPSIAKTLNAAVGMIGNTFLRERSIPSKVKGGKSRERYDYCLRVGPNPVYITKVRKPKSIEPPSVIVNPTFDDIMDIMEGEA